MSDASRSLILERLRSVLDQRHNPTVRYSGADQHIRTPRPSVLPARGQTEGAARTILFVSEAEHADAEVVQLASINDVAPAVKTALMREKITKLKAAPDQRLQAMDWSGLDVQFGRGAGDDVVGLSFAYAGVAETGTLVMCSGPQSPSTLNFLPDLHMVVVREDDIAANYEAVWARLRTDAKPDVGQVSEHPVMPRTVNWITGPSRTADIEQTLLLGAHGPRRLMIFVIDAETV